MSFLRKTTAVSLFASALLFAVGCSDGGSGDDDNGDNGNGGGGSAWLWVQISGLVIDANSGVPIEGASIAGPENPQAVRPQVAASAQDGTFDLSLPYLEGQSLTLSIEARGFEAATQQITPAGEFLPQVLELTPLVPALQVTPESHDFGAFGQAVVLEVGNGEAVGRALTYTAAASDPWLQILSGESGQVTDEAAPLLLRVDRGQLAGASGRQEASVVVTSDYGNQIIDISVEIPAGVVEAFRVDPPALRLEDSAFRGRRDAGTALLVNQLQEEVPWRASTNRPFLAISPAQGTLPPGGSAQLQVTVNRAGQTTDELEGEVLIVNEAGPGLVQLPVTATVLRRPVLDVEAAGIRIERDERGTELVIGNRGSAVLEWSLSMEGAHALLRGEPAPGGLDPSRMYAPFSSQGGGGTWIWFSQISGSTPAGRDSRVAISVSHHQLPVGDFAAVLLLEHNGGNPLGADRGQATQPIPIFVDSAPQPAWRASVRESVVCARRVAGERCSPAPLTALSFTQDDQEEIVFDNLGNTQLRVELSTDSPWLKLVSTARRFSVDLEPRTATATSGPVIDASGEGQSASVAIILDRAELANATAPEGVVRVSVGEDAFDLPVRLAGSATNDGRFARYEAPEDLVPVGMAYDPARGTLTVAGTPRGTQNAVVVQQLRGGRWEVLETEGDGPARVQNGQMVYDSEGDRYLVAVSAGANVAPRQLWALQGSRWELLAGDPGPGQAHKFGTLVQTRDEGLLFHTDASILRFDEEAAAWETLTTTAPSARGSLPASVSLIEAGEIYFTMTGVARHRAAGLTGWARSGPGFFFDADGRVSGETFSPNSDPLPYWDENARVLVTVRSGAVYRVEGFGERKVATAPPAALPSGMQPAVAFAPDLGVAYVAGAGGNGALSVTHVAIEDPNARSGPRPRIDGNLIPRPRPFEAEAFFLANDGERALYFRVTDAPPGLLVLPRHGRVPPRGQVILAVTPEPGAETAPGTIVVTTPVAELSVEVFR